MEQRVGFESDAIRSEFFLAVRKIAGKTSWDALAKLLELSRRSFQIYQYGECLLPNSLFEKMLAYLPAEKQVLFKEQIFAKPGNWGASKGARVTSQKHPEFIKKAREQAILRMKEKALEKPIMDISLSKELCEFIGAIIGDGSVDGFLQERNGLSKYHVSITGHSILDRDYLSRHHPEIIKSLFDINSHICFRKDCNAMVLNVFSKKLFCLLTERFGFVPGNKIYTTKIPEEIMNSTEDFVFAAIRGIFDTDGCVFFDKRKAYDRPYPRIIIQIKSEPLYLQLKEFLGRYFSIYAKCNNRDTYCVEVYGHNQFNKWMKLIGFSNKKHLERISLTYKPVADSASAISA